MRRTIAGIMTIIVTMVTALLFIPLPQPIASNALPTSTNAKVAPVAYPKRLEILNQTLGIPLKDLATMDDSRIRDLYEKNADRLGVRIYRLVRDRDGIEHLQHIAGSKTRPQPKTPTPTPIIQPKPQPYPGPQGRLPQSPQSTSKVFLPLIMKSPDPNEVNELKARMDKAMAYIDWLYQSPDGVAFVKEYSGCPVGIRNLTRQDGYDRRLVGHYYQTKSQPVGKVIWVLIGYDYELSDVTFEEAYDWDYGEPHLACDIYYGFNGAGRTLYQVSKIGWSGNDWVNVYLGDMLVFENVAGVPNNTTVQYDAGVEGRLPAHRYTVRHAIRLGALAYALAGQQWKADKLSTLANIYGFWTPDIYAPMFGSGQSAADDYMYNRDAYHDCDLTNRGMDSTLSWGYVPHRYGYESKVCINRDVYILLTRQDWLVPALQAIHILNKYNNPDYVYPHPNPFIGGNTTPRQIARYIESSGWNGYGIYAWGKNSAYASSVRTNAFLALESMLGWGYGDSTSRWYAEQTANVLRQVQWGMPPFEAYMGETADEGYVYRPNQTGGEMLSWTTGGSFVFSLSPRTFLSDLIDMFSMPNEFQGITPSNAESTLTYWAAIRMYLRYKHGITYP